MSTIYFVANALWKEIDHTVCTPTTIEAVTNIIGLDFYRDATRLRFICAFFRDTCVGIEGRANRRLSYFICTRFIGAAICWGRTTDQRI
jgi:hypothetical protein